MVHAAHGNWGQAGKSFGLRLAAPIAVGYLAYEAGKLSCNGGASDNRSCATNVAIVGAFIGVAGAIALDAAFLAREKVATEPTEFAIVPSLSIHHSGVDLGFVGVF
jgi:hypothetical protein